MAFEVDDLTFRAGVALLFDFGVAEEGVTEALAARFRAAGAFFVIFDFTIFFAAISNPEFSKRFTHAKRKNITAADKIPQR